MKKYETKWRIVDETGDDKKRELYKLNRDQEREFKGEKENEREE
jgi:hypothetical protein